MIATETIEPEDSDDAWLVVRPPAVLMELPLATRWEVTRRHPYYLHFWQAARRHHQQPSTDPLQRALDEAAVLILLAIGVSCEPPPPSADWESLGASQLSRAWQSGAVAPVTLRSLVGMLLAALPPDACASVGEILQDHAAANTPAKERLFSSLQLLGNCKNPALDCFPNAPVLGINVNAPQRVIEEAVITQVQQWKKERGLSERRRRDDKLEEYLAVWDLREGWCEDHYDLDREKTLRKIAQDQHISLSTVANRYSSAFRLIVGADYTPERWVRVIAAWKIAFSDTEVSKAARVFRRPQRSPIRQPVPASRLVDASKEWLEQTGIAKDEIAMTDLFLDIRTLIDAGRTDEEIMQELELPQDAPPLIAYFRQRQDDPH
jgi:hypothetical protein